MSAAAVLLALAVAAVGVFDVAVAVNITVGAPNGGWDLSTDYQTWVASQTFRVGEELSFSDTHRGGTTWWRCPGTTTTPARKIRPSKHDRLETTPSLSRPRGPGTSSPGLATTATWE